MQINHAEELTSLTSQEDSTYIMAQYGWGTTVWRMALEDRIPKRVRPL